MDFGFLMMMCVCIWIVCVSWGMLRLDCGGIVFFRLGKCCVGCVVSIMMFGLMFWFDGCMVLEIW